MHSDCSGNKTEDFCGNSLAVHCKAYSELLPVLPFYVVINVANILYGCLISSTIGKASGIAIVCSIFFKHTFLYVLYVSL